MRASLTKGFIVFALIGSLTACGHMTTRDRSTLTGVAIGAGAGAILSGGSAWGAAGGAAIGGVIGNQIGK